MKLKQIMQYVLLLSLLVASCTSIEKDTVFTSTLSTKSFGDNEYALSEKEAITKAEQFFLGLEELGRNNTAARSISSMNLSAKAPQVKTIIRTIEYDRNDIEQVPVYVVNYKDKKTNAAGGYVVMVGDKRLNRVLVYSDTGAWGEEDLMMENFLNLFWGGVDEYIKHELALSSFATETVTNTIPVTRGHGDGDCPYCDYYSAYAYIDNAKQLARPAVWSQLEPYNEKLAPLPTCPPFPEPVPSSFYAVGCVATAMGQIMAYHKRPTSGSYINYLGQTVNTAYNWNTMLTSPYANSLSSQGKEMVQHLLAEIGQRVIPAMVYECIGSRADILQAYNGFRNMTYSTAYEILYNYSTVSSEIYANRPVVAFGNKYLVHPFTSHAWVMDGVNTQTVVKGLYKYCPTLPNDPPVLQYILESHTLDYVSCNIGTEIPINWNGYYLSFLFSSNTQILTHIQ